MTMYHYKGGNPVKGGTMKKYLFFAAALIFIASGAYADPQYQQPQSQTQYQAQESHSSAAASVKNTLFNANTNVNENKNTNLNTAVGIGGQGGKAVSGSIAVAPTTVSPTQTVTVNGVPVTQGVTITPAPVVVQEAQRVIPNAVMSPQQTFIPSVQPVEPSGGVVTRGMPELMSTIPGASVTLWKQDGVSFDLKDIDGDVSSDVKVRYTPVKGTASRGKADGRLTVFKEKPQGTRAAVRPSRTLVGLATVEATVPGMTYAELEIEIHKIAKAKGATAINVTAQGMKYKTKSSGFNVGAQLGVSAIGTLFGQNAVYGPMFQAMYQSLTANIDELKFYDVEFER
jgi:hypothetical protein